MLKFMIYDILDDRAVYRTSIEIDPNSSKSANDVKYLFQLHKSNKSYVRAVDATGVHFLTKPRKRGRSSLASDVIIMAHELFVEQKKSSMQIQVAIYSELGVEISADQLASVLSQKTYTDVPGVDHLRQKAEEMMPKKTGRKKKIDEEMDQKIYEMFEGGMSGNAISKELNISSMSVNNRIRAKYGYRKKKENKND